MVEPAALRRSKRNKNARKLDVECEPEHDAKSSGAFKRRKKLTPLRRNTLAYFQKWRCNISSCRKLLPPSFDVDHIIPLHKGGTNDVTNLQILCCRCHRMKCITEQLERNRTDNCVKVLKSIHADEVGPDGRYIFLCESKCSTSKSDWEWVDEDSICTTGIYIDYMSCKK